MRPRPHPRQVALQPLRVIIASPDTKTALRPTRNDTNFCDSTLLNLPTQRSSAKWVPSHLQYSSDLANLRCFAMMGQVAQPFCVANVLRRRHRFVRSFRVISCPALGGLSCLATRLCPKGASVRRHRPRRSLEARWHRAEANRRQGDQALASFRGRKPTSVKPRLFTGASKRRCQDYGSSLLLIRRSML